MESKSGHEQRANESDFEIEDELVLIVTAVEQFRIGGREREVRGLDMDGRGAARV
jgi:hypothetical protein